VITKTGNEIRCGIKGKFKKLYELKKDKLTVLDIAAVGDFVNFDMNADGTGIIYEIDERHNYLSRKSPKLKGVSTRGERLEQIIAANIDTLFIVTSIKHPGFNNRLVDRLIVTAFSSGIDVKLIINKIDLDKKKEAYRWKSLYEKIGYSVFLTDGINKVGIDDLHDELINKVNVFWGPSGVGKSTILNALFPSFNFKVGEVSEYSQKGTHTTVTSVMKKVDEQTYLVDTPGLREIEPYGIKKEDLGHYFIEFLPYINDCKFNTCTHHHEPGCEIIEQVEHGNIDERRYVSYLNMLETIEDDIIF
jgi:ribosome biogenesis GTPase